MEELLVSIAEKEKKYQETRILAEKARDLVLSMKNEISSLQAEEAELLVKVPPAPARLRQVQAWLEERLWALGDQQTVKEEKEAEMHAAEAQVHMAEAEVFFLSASHEAATAEQEEKMAAALTTAVTLREADVAAGKRIVSKMEKAERLRAEREEADEALREEKIRVAEEERAKAKDRMKEAMEKLNSSKAKVEALNKEHIAARQASVLRLKNSLEGVRSQFAEKANLYRQIQKQKQELRDAEFQVLQEQGLNPYEVYRRRDIEAATEKARQKIRKNIAKRQEQIAAELAVEEAAEEQRIAEQRADRALREEFDRSMGPAAREARLDEYMRKTTTLGVTVLDPTGRLPVDPSAATLIRPRAFGTGGASPELLARETARFPDVAREVPALSTAVSGVFGPSDSDVDSRGGDSPPRSPVAAVKSGATRGWKQLEMRTLTKHEQDLMRRAKEKHKSNISSARTMMGRTFQADDSFMANPTEVVFKDFEAGETYKAKVRLINKAYARNTFRVLDVPGQFCNVLEVDYELPGSLATGVGGEITIVYKPKVNEDMETYIPLMAETGTFSIPVRCLTKKAILSVSTPRLDFGSGVTLGETRTLNLVLSNAGALGVNFKVEASPEEEELETETPDNEPEHENMISMKGFHIWPAAGEVAGYSSTKVVVKFAPLQGGSHRLPLTFLFRAIKARKLSIQPEEVVLVGIGRDVPIYVERPYIDFKCVLVGHMYREVVNIVNGGKSAMKISVVKRSEIADFFDFTPETGFAQAGESFPVLVRFRPTANTLQACAKFVTDAEQGIMEIPMKVSVPDQRLPVTFTLIARVTNSDLLFDPPSLSFGWCVMGEKTGVVLKISNKSALPQTFGFLSLPQGVSISPNDGFGHVLPGETLERVVAFQPPIVGPQTFSLNCRTTAGRSFSLECKACGVQTPLRLSHNAIKMPATPINDLTTVSVFLSNTTSTNQIFQFGVPPNSGLTFSPHVGEVAAGSSLRVQIDFSPPLDQHPTEEELNRVEEQEQEEVEAVPESKNRISSIGRLSQLKEEDEEEDDEYSDLKAVDEEDDDLGFPSMKNPPQRDASDLGSARDQRRISLPWHAWRQWHITCYVKPPAGEGEAGPPPELHLSITTCAVLPDLALITPLKEVPGKMCYELDFGPVPVGRRVVRNVEVTNTGSHAVQLSSLPNDITEIFSIVNALRQLPPGGKQKVLLSFTPPARQHFLDIITIKSPLTRIRLALKGHGIAPDLRITPPEVMSKGLDLGDVLAGESRSASLTVTNTCPFPLTYTTVFKGAPDPNITSKPAFYCRPAEGTVGEGESQEVVVVFQPSRQRPYFQDTLLITVPYQQEELAVPVKGCCWEEGVFLVGPTYPPYSNDPFLEEQLARLAEATQPTPPPAPKPAGAGPPKAGTGGPGAAAASKEPAGRAPPARILQAVAAEPVYLKDVCTVVIEAGCLKSDKGGASGEVLIDELPAAAREAGWSVDNSRVVLGPGEKKPITFKFTAPMEATPAWAAYFGFFEYTEVEVGVTLKGGSPPPPTPEGRRVLLRVKAKLLPIARPGAPIPKPVVTPIKGKGKGKP